MDPEGREGKEDEAGGNAKHDTAEEMLLISTELDDVTLAELSKTPAKSKRISWHSSCTVSLSLSHPPPVCNSFSFSFFVFFSGFQ